MQGGLVQVDLAQDRADRVHVNVFSAVRAAGDRHFGRGEAEVLGGPVGDQREGLQRLDGGAGEGAKVRTGGRDHRLAGSVVRERAARAASTKAAKSAA